MPKQKIFIQSDGRSEINRIPQNVLNNKLNATIESVATHLAAMACRIRATIMPPYTHQTRIDHPACTQLIRSPIKKPVASPTVKRAKPSHSRHEVAPDNAVRAAG